MYTNSYNYLNLPNTSFFESTGTYLTTEGSFKNNIKFISTNSQSKEDWQIIRKIFSNLKHVNFFDLNNKNYILNNQKNFNLIKNFFTFLYYSSSTINQKNNYSYGKNCQNTYFYKNFKKQIKHKIFSTKLNIWLNDFYIGGIDSYSKYSPTMIKCSKQLRLTKNNFSHLI